MIRAFMDPLDTRPPSLENFLHYYKSQVPKRYSYSQIRAYTNNLADKIGKGGFGTVYKGKLPTGCLIAVKILDESKQSEHQFIAEVATVGRTYHVNLVRLLGYCSHRSKRALVYEYIVMVPSTSIFMEAMTRSWIGHSYIQLQLVQLVVLHTYTKSAESASYIVI